MSLSTPLDARLYRTALYLYPPRFRREFAEEMRRDFEEATFEAHAERSSLLAFRTRICADLVKTVLLQWARTGLPAIALVATVVPIVTATLLARLSQATPMVIPTENPNEEVVALVLLFMVVLLIVITTILLTVLVVHPRLKRRAR